MTEPEKRSVDYYQEAYMSKSNWKRTLMNAGVSLTVVGGGALVAEGAASAHDAVDHDGVAHHAVRGVVTAVGADSFTLSNHQGTETIDTTTTTTFAEPGTPVAPTTVAIGQTVASLDQTATTPTAVRVTVLLNRLSGKVIDVTGSSITLSGPRGTTRQALISPTTMVFSGKTAATNVTDGEFVTIFGTRDATTPTELDALFIDIASNVTRPVHAPGVNPNRGPGNDDHGDQGDRHGAPVTTTPPTTSVTPPTTPGTEPEPEPGDPDHNVVPGNDDHGDNDNGGNGGGEGGGGFSGSGSSGGGHGSSGHGGGH